MKLGLQFGKDNNEAYIVDLDHNDIPNIFKLCLNKTNRDTSDYPKETVISIAREVVEMVNAVLNLKKILR